jgi:RNA polymerase sigma-70 factor (ECF subfamily)
LAQSRFQTERRHGACDTDLPLSAEAARPWLTWQDEDLLVEYARKGTHEAFEELVHRYERRLYTYLRRYLNDAGLAEDAFQATFLAVHLHRHEFDPQRRFRPWVYRIATTRAIDLLRRDRRHRLVSLDARRQGHDLTDDDQPLHDLLDEQALPPSHKLETSEKHQRLRLLVDSLPVRLRGVLDLVMFRGLAYQEAAKALGIPLGTVKSRLHNAILHLRKTLAAAA